MQLIFFLRAVFRLAIDAAGPARSGCAGAVRGEHIQIQDRCKGLANKTRGYAAMFATIAAITAAGMPGQLAAQTDGASVTQPNILLILADDMGWGQPGFNGGTEVTTPNIDRIANEGVKLTQFYVQPMCTATRGALLTGRYPWKNGTHTLILPSMSTGMLTDERTIAEALRDAGYATWMVGKWHLGQWQQAHLPLQRGFDHHYGLYSGEIESFNHHRRYTKNHPLGILDWHRNERPVVEPGYSTFLMAEEAIQLIERHDGSHPFFLYLPFNAVHSKHDAPDEYLEQYKDLDDHKQRAQLKAMDDAIGQVMDALDSKGVLDDTLIMFLNDNGGTEQAGWNEPYRGKKSGFYEGGIRVPAVLRWPGRIPPGSDSDAMLHVVDLFPTFAGLASADTSTGLPLDGVDAWEAIAGGAGSPRDELVYAHGVIRKGDWKLIEDYVDYYDPAPESVLLYNIKDDPYETVNLAASETAKLAELRARLDHHQPYARDGEADQDIPDAPPNIYGAEENTAFGTEARNAVAQLLLRGNPGPSLLRIAASKARITLIYDKTLETYWAPPTNAFKVIVNPGYNSREVTDVEMSGNEIVLTLAQAAANGDIVGLTYEVPDSGEIRDFDGLDAVGVTWVIDEAEDAAAFSVTVAPQAITEGESATLTIAITNGAVFEGDQSVVLTASGTASASDYTVAPATLTLAAGASSATAVLTALNDQEEESEETVTVTASHGEVLIGSETVTITSISHDAALASLSLSGIDIETFSGAQASYTAIVGYGVETTSVTATASHPQAVVSIVPGSVVSLAEGENLITVTVTAEDGTTTETYSVAVTRTALPVLSIEAVASPLSEGENAQFRVSRTGPVTEELTVYLRARNTDYSMRIGAEQSTWIGYTGISDNTVIQDDIRVTWRIREDAGYILSPDAASATVVLEENDVAEFALLVEPDEIAEGGSATIQVNITNGVTFAEDQAIALDFSGGTAVKDTDFTVSPEPLTLLAASRRATATVTAMADSGDEGDETVSVSASHVTTAISAASFTITDSELAPLTAVFEDLPQSHDGATAFTFTLRFNEPIRTSYRTLRDQNLQVAGGTARRARRVNGSSAEWEIKVRPAGTGGVTVSLPADVACGAGGVCTADGRRLSGAVTAMVPGP